MKYIDRVDSHNMTTYNMRVTRVSEQVGLRTPNVM